jgi:hypothetical protein
MLVISQGLVHLSIAVRFIYVFLAQLQVIPFRIGLTILIQDLTIEQVFQLAFILTIQL